MKNSFAWLIPAAAFLLSTSATVSRPPSPVPHPPSPVHRPPSPVPRPSSTVLPAPGDLIYFQNPSFEDAPRASASPKGWHSYTPGSTPDILPGAWGIRFDPKDGQTCLGLVTRDDGTCEDICQAPGQALKARTCYKFNLFLAHASSYVGYNQPIRLRVWGGNTPGAKEMLLDSSPLIDHADWRSYEFQFITPREVRYLTFEAYYGAGVFMRYKGNILLDLCSPIEECDRA